MHFLAQYFGQNTSLSQGVLLGTLLVMRIIPIVFQTPFLGGKLVPAETRMALGMGLSALAYPFAQSQLQGPIDVNGMIYIALMFKELFMGYVIGFFASEIFYAMEYCGRILDTMRGSNLAEAQVPEIQLRASPIGAFNFQLLLVVFCTLNGHGYFIQSILDSFAVVPADSWPRVAVGFAAVVDQMMKYSSDLFAIGVGLVFPGAFATFLIDIMFGMFNRIAPQLNAYFMAMGIKALAGIAMFTFALSMFLGELARHLENTLVFIRRIIAMFG